MRDGDPEKVRTVSCFLEREMAMRNWRKTGTVVFSGLLFFGSFLFVRPKRNEPKKEGAGNDNFSLFWQNTIGITLPKKAEVRSISGLPPHLPLEITVHASPFQEPQIK